MKKILLSISLLFTLAYTESSIPTISSDSEVGKWRSFVGVEGGVGVFGISRGFIFSGNALFCPKINNLGLGYSVGILGGWQKYTYEKVGIRNTLGFAFSYVPNISSIRGGGKYSEFCFLDCKNAKEYNYDNNWAQHYDFYYALEGLFDFVKSGKSRFGMSLGASLNFSIGDSRGVGDSMGGATFFFGTRIGLYAQFENSILDLTLKFPLGGFAGKGNVNVTTLTLGYKHLF